MSRVIKPECWQFGKPLRVAVALADEPVAMAAGGEADSLVATAGFAVAGADRSVTPIAGRDCVAAERQAEEIVADARARAEELIDQAVSGAERLVAESRQAGYSEGRDDGYAAGLQAAEAEIAARRNEAEELLRAAQAEREQQLLTVRADIAKLAVAVAEKIVRRRLSEDPELIIGIVGDAISRSHNGETLRVRANPRDIPIIQEREGALVASVDGLKELELIEDPGIAQGGCLVETGHGYIDARIDRQLELVEDALRVAVGYAR